MLIESDRIQERQRQQKTGREGVAEQDSVGRRLQERGRMRLEMPDISTGPENLQLGSLCIHSTL